MWSVCCLLCGVCAQVHDFHVFFSCDGGGAVDLPQRVIFFFWFSLRVCLCLCQCTSVFVCGESAMKVNAWICAPATASNLESASRKC